MCGTNIFLMKRIFIVTNMREPLRPNAAFLLVFTVFALSSQIVVVGGVVVPAEFTVNSGGPYNVTLGVPLVLNATVSGGSGSYTYSWSMRYNFAGCSFSNSNVEDPTVTCTGPLVGTDYFTLTANDSAGNGPLLSSATITIAADQPPTVSISFPSDGATYGYVSGSTAVTVEATASDPENSLDKIELWYLRTDVGSSWVSIKSGASACTSSPCSGSFTVPSQGTYTIAANAWDDLIAPRTQATVSISSYSCYNNASQTCESGASCSTGQSGRGSCALGYVCCAPAAAASASSSGGPPGDVVVVVCGMDPSNTPDNTLEGTEVCDVDITTDPYSYLGCTGSQYCNSACTACVDIDSCTSGACTSTGCTSDQFAGTSSSGSDALCNWNGDPMPSGGTCCINKHPCGRGSCVDRACNATTEITGTGGDSSCNWNGTSSVTGGSCCRLKPTCNITAASSSIVAGAGNSNTFDVYFNEFDQGMYITTGNFSCDGASSATLTGCSFSSNAGPFNSNGTTGTCTFTCSGYTSPGTPTFSFTGNNGTPLGTETASCTRSFTVNPPPPPCSFTPDSISVIGISGVSVTCNGSGTVCCRPLNDIVWITVTTEGGKATFTKSKEESQPINLIVTVSKPPQGNASTVDFSLVRKGPNGVQVKLEDFTDLPFTFVDNAYTATATFTDDTAGLQPGNYEYIGIVVAVRDGAGDDITPLDSFPADNVASMLVTIKNLSAGKIEVPEASLLLAVVAALFTVMLARLGRKKGFS